MSKKLNFFPYYKNLLVGGKKDTTIRLARPKNSFTEGEIVSITIGWLENNCNVLFKAKIISIKTKKIENLSEKDLEGESPDCKSPDALLYTLSCIYRKVLSLSDKVRVIKFERVFEKRT